MIADEEPLRDLALVPVAAVGSLLATGSRWEPYRLVDPDGARVEAVTAFFQDLQAGGRTEATVRSYGMDLLRWFRFLWAVEVAWDRATRAEARDFCRWLLIAGKPARSGPVGSPTAVAGSAYAASVRAHSETVLRSFYDFHRDMGTGPILNPFPLDRSGRGGRANAHHNPMDTTATSGPGCIGPGRRGGFRAVSRTRTSTGSSLGFPHTGIGPWSRSTSPPGLAPRSCCRPPAAESTPADS